MKFKPNEGLSILDYLGLKMSDGEIVLFSDSFERISDYSPGVLSATRKDYALAVPNEIFQRLIRECELEKKLSKKQKEKLISGMIEDNHELTRARFLEFDYRVEKTGLDKIELNPGEVFASLSQLPKHRFILTADAITSKGHLSFKGKYFGPSVFELLMLPTLTRLLYPKTKE